MAENYQGKSVKANYNFKAQNTDELSFNKNDIIVITQSPEGGWWEGTLDTKTGWFPMNYVELIKQDSTPSTQSTASQCQEMRKNRETILETLIESEQQYVGELEEFLTQIIQPLYNAFSPDHSFDIQRTYSQLDELIKFHRHLLSILHDCIKTNHRIGGVFLQLAPTLKPLFEMYCQQHAKTILFCNSNKDKILSTLSKIDPNGTNNYLLLTKNLSLPLNRLEKYSVLLKEYLHNLEEFHPDRGDAQRAAEYYSELARSGNELRKRKEWELEIMNSTIHGLDGEVSTEKHLSSYGEALCLTPVNVIFENGQSSERIALLYSSVLIFLSITNSPQEYKFENHLSLSQLILSKIDDDVLGKRALKISAPSLSMIVSFPSTMEFNEWCDKFRSLTYEHKHSEIETPHTPQVSKSVSMLGHLPKSATGAGALLKIPLRSPTKTPWSKSCLRPHSPNRIRLGQTIGSSDGLNESSSGGSGGGANKTLKRFMTMKKMKANEFLKRVETSEGDSLLLSVIEAYCGASGKSRHSVSAGSNEQNTPNLVGNSSPIILNDSININNVTSPQPITSLDKIMPLTLDNNRLISETLNELRLALKMVQQELEEEKIARRKLESQIQRLLTAK